MSRRPARVRRPALLLATGLVLAACGGGQGSPDASSPSTGGAPTAPSTGPLPTRPGPPPQAGTDASGRRPALSRVPRTATGEADAADLRVVERWFRAVRTGRPSTAAGLMRDGTRWVNGDVPLELRDRAAREAVVRELPCGAVPVSSGGADGGYVVLRLRLAALDGTPCAADGVRVAVAVRVRDGRIDDWVRLPDPDGGARATPGVEA